MFCHPHLSGARVACSPGFEALLKEKGLKWDMKKADGHGVLASWVEREAALAMVGHLLTAVELDLVRPAQFRMVYW